MPNWGVFIWWKWWIYFCLISTFKGFFGFTLVCMLLCIFHSFYDLFNQNLFSAFQTVFQRMNPERGSKAQMKGMRQLHIFTKNAKVPVWTQELWKSLENLKRKESKWNFVGRFQLILHNSKCLSAPLWRHREGAVTCTWTPDPHFHPCFSLNIYIIYYVSASFFM